MKAGGNTDSVVRSSDATNIGAGGIEATGLLPHRRRWFLDALTSIRTERALRFVLPIPLLLYLSYTPVPKMIFGHLCIILYTIQAALLPPVVTMVPIVLCCALPAIVIALTFLTTIWCLYVAAAQGHFSETQVNGIVLVLSFWYFLLASNLRIGKLASIMTIAYYAMVYALEYAAVMTKYVMLHGIDAHLAPTSVKNYLPPWLVNSLPSTVFDAIDYIPINIDAGISPGLLGKYSHYKGVKELIGVPVRVIGSIAAGLKANLPSGIYMVKFAWQSEKELGIISALMIWAFISYAAFCVTLFLPPWRTGTKLYTNAAAGCHASLAANIIDWLSRASDPLAIPPEGTEIEEVGELQDAASESSKLISGPIPQSLSSRVDIRKARQQTMLPQIRAPPPKILKEDGADGKRKRKENNHLRFADDLTAEDAGKIENLAPTLHQDSASTEEDRTAEDFNPYFGYDITRFQNAAQAKKFVENSNITGSLKKFPSYRARLELAEQTISTMQGPLLLSAFETSVVVGNQTTNHNFSNDLPERLKIGSRLLEISVWLYVIQIQSTLKAVLKANMEKDSIPIIRTGGGRLGGDTLGGDTLRGETRGDETLEGESSLKRGSQALGRNEELCQSGLLGLSEGAIPESRVVSFDESEEPKILLPSLPQTGLLESAIPPNKSSSMSATNRLSAASFDSRRRSSGIDSGIVEMASQSLSMREDGGRRLTLDSAVSSRLSRDSPSSISAGRSTESHDGSQLRSSAALNQSSSDSGERDVSADLKPRLSVGSRFVDMIVRQRDKKLQSRVVPANPHERKRSASTVNLAQPKSNDDLIDDILLSVYHTVRLSETNENSKRSLNENYEERKVLIAYQKLCDLQIESDQYPILPLYKNGLIASTIELLDLRRDAFIQLKSRSWKRTAISFATLIMGLPLFFYSLFVPWFQMLRHFREDRKLLYSSVEKYIDLESPPEDVVAANLSVNLDSLKYADDPKVRNLSVQVRGSPYDWRFNSAVWFALRLAIGNTILFGLALYLESWRRLDVEGHSEQSSLTQFIDLEKLLGTKYAAWACIGFITTITETAPATIKRAILRLTGVVLGTLSAWALLSISRDVIEIHACWIMITCFIAVWVTAHPANPAIGFDPSWGYAAQLFTYQQVIIVALVAVQGWNPTEMVISRLTAQILGIGTAVLLSCAFFPTTPSLYIKHQCARASCHLQEHYADLAAIYRHENDQKYRENAEIHLRRANNAISAARRAIVDNDIFVEFKWLNLNPIHVELISTMERLLQIHTEWTNRISLISTEADLELAQLMEKMRLLVVMFASMIRSTEQEIHQKCYAVLRKEVVDWFSSPKVISQARAWDQKYIARTFAPVELLQVDRLIQLISALKTSIVS